MFHVVIYCPGSARKPGQPLSAQLSEAKVESGTSPTAFKGLVSSPGLDKCDAASPSLSSIQLILVSGTSRARTATHLVVDPHAAVRVRYAPAEARPLTSVGNYGPESDKDHTVVHGYAKCGVSASPIPFGGPSAP